LEDSAGNQRRDLAVTPLHLRYDPTPPRLAFEAVDSEDPLRVEVRARDEHSGLAMGEIEMRKSGSEAWHPLDTRVESSRLLAFIDDERFRRGSYLFRARAVDRAGNESSTSRRRDGTSATIRLPLRATTLLRVGAPDVRIRRRVVRRHGRRRVIRRRFTVLRHSAEAPYGARLKLRGRLTNADGQALEGGAIEVFEDRGPGVSPQILGTAQVDGRGYFRYALRAVRNRRILFRYRGSRRIGAAVAAFRLRVPAATTMKAMPTVALNGETVLFSGRIRSRPVPSTGKLIEIQAFFRGRWRTISTTRSDSEGRWQFNYRFGGTFGRVRYRFRALLPVESGYPYTTGTSKTVRVLVIGL
jgi:hypothetical protein